MSENSVDNEWCDDMEGWLRENLTNYRLKSNLRLSNAKSIQHNMVSATTIQTNERINRLMIDLVATPNWIVTGLWDIVVDDHSMRI